MLSLPAGSSWRHGVGPAHIPEERAWPPTAAEVKGWEGRNAWRDVKKLFSSVQMGGVCTLLRSRKTSGNCSHKFRINKTNIKKTVLQF